MNVPEFSVHRPVTTLMMFFGVILVGAFCLSQMPIDLFPEMDIPMITVVTPYEGAGPEDIEEKITQPLERVLATVEDVDDLFSTSREGVSVIRMSFSWQTDLDTRANDVRDAVNMVQRDLPDEADRSRIFKFDLSQFPIMVLGVRASQSYEDLQDILEDEVASRLESIPGVASVQIGLPLRRQVNIDLDRERLASYGLTADDVVRTVGRENRETSAGSIKMGYTDYLPRVPGEFDSIEPINDVVLAARGGSIVRLRDVGTATDGFKQIDTYITVNGLPGGVLLVNKQSDANTVTVARAVRKRLPEILESLPRDIEVILVMDGSLDIVRMIRTLARTLLVGGGLAMLAVLIFLREVRSTFVIGLAMPFSLICSGAVMYLLDYTINMMTLFALIVVIGMVVDNAIVVLENITRHRQEGESPDEGAIYGTSEVGMAITASTLTTLCIFFPLLFVKGITKVIFGPFAAVAGVILLASLFSALTLTPMLASRVLPEDFIERRRRNALRRAGEAVFDGIAGAYGALLAFALRHRAAVVFGAAVLFVGTLSLVPSIGWEFLPKEDRAFFRGTVELPVGTPVEKTREMMRDVERALREEIPPEDIRAFYTICGGAEGGFATDEGAHIGRFGIRLVYREDRDWTVFEMVDRLRRRIDEATGRHSIQDFRIDLEEPMQNLISGGERPISVNIMGDDIDKTDRIAAELEQKLAQIDGLVDLAISRQHGAPELWVNVDRDKASSLGLSLFDVTEAVRTNIYGRVAGKYRVTGDEYDIRVRLREQDRSDAEDLGRIPLRLPSGRLVRTENVADVAFERGPIEIERKNQMRIVRVEGDVSGRSLGGAIAEAGKAAKTVAVPPDVSVVMGGQSEDIRESYFWLTLALGVGAMLVYMVMASQFESLLHPFVVMFSVPFAFVGVAWALFLSGHNLNVIVFLGMLMLVGIVVNNAIVLVDYINVLRARGVPMAAAIRRAGETRLRPVLMTAFTTILALSPMAFGKGQGSEVWNPLGITIMGGLLVATLVTLVIVPVMYSILEGRMRLPRQRRATQ